MKPNTMLITVTRVGETKISYTVDTDIVPKEFHYIIPHKSDFPYDQLVEGDKYALISVKLDNAWHWWMAYWLKHSTVLIDKRIGTLF